MQNNAFMLVLWRELYDLAIHNCSPTAAMDYTKFFWVSRGNGRCMVSGVTRAFGPNTVIFIRHNAPHQFKLSSNVFGILVSLEPNVAVALPNQNLFLPI